MTHIVMEKMIPIIINVKRNMVFWKDNDLKPSLVLASSQDCATSFVCLIRNISIIPDPLSLLISWFMKWLYGDPFCTPNETLYTTVGTSHNNSS